MYNFFSIAINKIKNCIPNEILVDAFIGNKFDNYNRNYPNDSPISLDAIIKDEIIYKRVHMDLNLKNTNRVYVSLKNAKIERVYFNEYDFRFQYVCVIDKEATGGRSIISPIEISYSNTYSTLQNQSSYSGSSYMGRGGMVSNATYSLSNAIDSNGPLSSARVSLINENTILIADNVILPRLSNTYLLCLLSIDDNFSDLKPKSIPYVTDLVLYATKAYIYNKMILKIDQGRLVGGQELGRYREIIDSYADAENMYKELLEEKIGKILFMNNDDLMRSYISGMLGGVR